ncbi:MAG: hypothetical protein JHD02_06710 [Thermoleophilaceae bacterium]|nr:hypothetical protein [Thermoleophilaceae bacterium]
MPSGGFRVAVDEWTSADAGRAWDVIVPIDLTTVFTGLKPVIPAVVAVREQTGNWDAVGQTRKIDLADGSRTGEIINSCDRPALFTYTVGPFSGPVGKLVDRAEGEFKFEPMSDGTYVRWTYVWHPRPGGAPIVWVLSKIWRIYARRSILALVKLADGR